MHLTVAGHARPRASSPGCCAPGAPVAPGSSRWSTSRPTILDLAGVDRPSSMEGRRFEAVADGRRHRRRSAPQHLDGDRRGGPLPRPDGGARRRHLRRAPGRAVDRRRRWRSAAARPGGRRAVALAALAMLAFLPATYLAGLIDFHAAPSTAYWVFVIGLAVGPGAARHDARAAGACSTRCCCASASVFGLLVVDMLLGAPLQLNTVFGYSPTVGGRFAGMGNLAYGQFAGRGVPALRAAVATPGGPQHRHRGGVRRPRRRDRDRRDADLGLGRRRGARVRAGGRGDGGASCSATGSAGARSRVWGAAAVAVVAVFAAARPEPPRRPSHPPRPTRRGRRGSGRRRLRDRGDAQARCQLRRDHQLGLDGDGPHRARLHRVPPVACPRPRARRSARTSTRAWPGLAVVGFLGFAFNDSGIAVPGVMLGVVNASLVYLTVRTPPPEVAA